MIITNNVLLFWLTVFVLGLLAFFALGAILAELPRTVGSLLCFICMFLLSIGLLMARLFTVPPDTYTFYEEDEYDLTGLSNAVHAKEKVSSLTDREYVVNTQNVLTGRDSWEHVIPYDVKPDRSVIAKQYKK